MSVQSAQTQPSSLSDGMFVLPCSLLCGSNKTSKQQTRKACVVGIAREDAKFSDKQIEASHGTRLRYCTLCRVGCIGSQESSTSAASDRGMMVDGGVS